MDLKSVINHLIEKNHQNRSAITLRSGQIFYGSVDKLFVNNHAEIRLGSQRLIAKLEAPLTSGKGYWFQVSTSDENIHLKILPSPTEVNDLFSLPGEHSRADKKLNLALINFLRAEQIPLTKDEIIQIGKLLADVDHIELGLKTIKMMRENQLPLQEVIFKSLYTAGNGPSTYEWIKQLHNLLTQEQTLSKNGRELLSLLQQMGMNDNYTESETANPSLVSTVLKEIKQSPLRMGFFYENLLLKNESQQESLQHSLKPLLVSFLQEHPAASAKLRDAAEQLLFRMNGFQLTSNENSSIQQIIYEIPVHIQGNVTELTLQWSGKRKHDGKLDSDYCRIIFYLNLKRMDETVIDMQVQNRVITVNIYNHSETIKNRAEPFLIKLKTALQELNYQLSGVHFKIPVHSVKTNQTVEFPKLYSRVDIKI